MMISPHVVCAPVLISDNGLYQVLKPNVTHNVQVVNDLDPNPEVVYDIGYNIRIMNDTNLKPQELNEIVSNIQIMNDIDPNPQEVNNISSNIQIVSVQNQEASKYSQHLPGSNNTPLYPLEAVDMVFNDVGNSYINQDENYHSNLGFGYIEDFDLNLWPFSH